MNHADGEGDGPGKVLLGERDFLRRELAALKECQLRYLWLTILGTGLLFGATDSVDDSKGTILLAPLVVILPFWWLFFDKATTITRIVGYLRVLEQILNGSQDYVYLGWENALAEYRRRQEAGTLAFAEDTAVSSWEKVVRLLTLKTPHKYWVINFYTYLSLALLSLLFAAVTSTADRAWSLVAIAFGGAVLAGLSLRYNWEAVYSLVYLRSSYDANESFWKQVLGRPLPAPQV